MTATTSRRPAGARRAQRARPPLRPTKLTVLYDAHCPVCRRARRWVEQHRQLVPVQFVPAGSELARRCFPDLDVGSTLVDVTVITDQGAVLRGDRAWIAVLWAVARTRATAIELTHGRGVRRFHGVKGATEAIRRFAGSLPDAPPTTGAPHTWPPPRVPAHEVAHDATHTPDAARTPDAVCVSCRT